MVEFPDAEERRAMLTQLVGIENNIWMQVGNAEKIRPVANEDLERSDGTKTSAVHFLRFELDSTQVQALKNGARLSAGIDHKNYQVEVSPVAENVRNHAACAVGRGEYLTQQLIKHSACLPARIPAAFYLGNSR
jgi:hypothetical protein